MSDLPTEPQPFPEQDADLAWLHALATQVAEQCGAALKEEVSVRSVGLLLGRAGRTFLSVSFCVGPVPTFLHLPNRLVEQAREAEEEARHVRELLETLIEAAHYRNLQEHGTTPVAVCPLDPTA